MKLAGALIIGVLGKEAEVQLSINKIRMNSKDRQKGMGIQQRGACQTYKGDQPMQRYGRQKQIRKAVGDMQDARKTTTD
jgi:hypothetical protein